MPQALEGGGLGPVSLLGSWAEEMLGRFPSDPGGALPVGLSSFHSTHGPRTHMAGGGPGRRGTRPKSLKGFPVLSGQGKHQLRLP